MRAGAAGFAPGAALACVLALAAGSPTPAGESVPVPEGYKTDAYRSPVPDRLEGVTVVSDREAHDLWEAGGTVFVDVLPRAPRPKGLPEGTIWRDKPRHTIPGAIWLPNVGYGAIAPQVDAYFRENLAEETGGDRDCPILIFCLADCWMSWNAAKRAREEYGYSRVYWYPDGTDGWAFMDWPLERIEPEQPQPEE